MYTPGFAAPELHAKKELGPWTDIYSIGASIFNCMVGVPPQSAIEREREDRMDQFYAELESIYTPDILKLVRWSLMLDPLKRPQSVFALQKAMRLLPDPAQAPDTLLSRLRKMVN
jgi:serine/threonine protein kinase